MANLSNKNLNIMVVDDDASVRDMLCRSLESLGYSPRTAKTAEEGLDLLAEEPADILITDYMMPGMNGLELLQAVKEDNPACEVVVITGHGSIENAVSAMKHGAFDYMSKPLELDELERIIDQIKVKRNILPVTEEDDPRVADAVDEVTPLSGMIGMSSDMRHIYQLVNRIAGTSATVLITGESGTGKSLVAKAIHEADASRKGKPFVEISCGALSETLLESELFGHVKGAFTGAVKDKEGRFEYAKSGTVFLDEIDAFSMNLQVKLLKVLQDGEYERVGDNVTKRTDARVIVATNQLLKDLVKKGYFREDLFYRINVISIQMPSLRDRREDIPELAGFFVGKYAKLNNKEVTGLSDDVIEMFQNYAWPGNIRELENAIEAAVIMAQGKVLTKEDVPNHARFGPVLKKRFGAKSLKQAVAEPEREHILEVLRECRWNRIKAAKMLGVNRTTLYNKMKKYNITDNDRSA